MANVFFPQPRFSSNPKKLSKKLDLDINSKVSFILNVRHLSIDKKKEDSFLSMRLYNINYIIDFIFDQMTQGGTRYIKYNLLIVFYVP